MINSTKYFSWGDIRGQNKNGTVSYSFSRDNYNAGICGSGHNLSSDIPQGNTTYDAATTNMGSRWKMFTPAQGQELIDCTNSTRTSINGVNGWKFTSKKDSSKYIFLPEAGYCKDTYFSNAESEGHYWSTSLSDSTKSNLMYLYSLNAYIRYLPRHEARSVRAIQ